MANPTIVYSLSINNSTANMAFSRSGSFSAKDESAYLKVTKLTTASTTINYDTVLDPRYFSFAHMGESGSILIAVNGTDYDQEVAPGDVAMVRLRSSDRIETQTVVTVADVSASLDAKYFTLDGNSGTWAVWIDVDDSGTAAPAHGQNSAAEIKSIVTDDTAASVALAIYTDLIADEAFMADFTVTYDATVDNDFITITDNFTSIRTNIADTGTTGFTVATTQEGAVGRTVSAKSSTGEIDALISVMPN